MDTSVISLEFLTPQWSHIPSASWTWCSHPQLYQGPLHAWHRLDIICTAFPAGQAGPEGEGPSEPCFPCCLPFLGLNAIHAVLFTSYTPLPACKAGVGSRKLRWPAWRSVLQGEGGGVFSPCTRPRGHLTPPGTPQAVSGLLSLWPPPFSPFFMSHLFSLHLCDKGY